MASGCVVGTIRTTTWLPFDCSNAASLASSADDWSAVKRAGEVGDPRRELRNGDEALLRECRRDDCSHEPQPRREQQASQQRTGFERERRGDHGITPRRAPWGTRREECLSWSQVRAWAPAPEWPAAR